MTREVVVTGASGFIGQALLSELARRDVTTIAVARRRFRAPAPVRVVVVTDYDETPVHADSIVVHLAEGAHIGEAERKGEAYVRAVARQTAALLARHPARFVYASSGRVYGNRSAQPHAPDDPTAPDCVYARAKLAAEEMVQEAEGGVAVRIGNIYGPPVKRNTVIGEILAQMGKTGPLKIRDARPARDYLWIGDVASGLADIALGQAVGVFNLGTGIATSAGTLALTALNAAAISGRDVTSMAGSDDRAPDIIALNPATTGACFGWRPQVRLEDGLRRLINETDAA
jgi:UDP-glucose 4-epimerase